jgi:hypothetical protein
MSREPWKDKPLPKRTKERIDMLLPNCKVSQIDILDPKCVRLRTLRQLPRFVDIKTEAMPPMRALPAPFTEILLPRRLAVLREIVDPNARKPSTLAELPVGTA